MIIYRSLILNPGTGLNKFAVDETDYLVRVPSMGYAVFSKRDLITQNSAFEVVSITDEGYHIENDQLRVTLGTIQSLFHKKSYREMFKYKGGFMMHGM